MQDFSFIDSKEYKDFITQHQNEDIIKLRLKKFSDLPFDKDFAIRQIDCRNRTKHKLPTLWDKIIFPTDISTEQCTSEILAEFHANLFEGCEKVVDFTSGLGIDSYFISKGVKHLQSIEIDENVSNTAKYNFKRLGADNATAICDNAEHFAETIDSEISACFIDPSRRVEKDKTIRSYGLKDCQPDLNQILGNIHSKCNFIIVKASPMIDVTQTLSDFPNISDIWILSVKNECRELLFKILLKDAKVQGTVIHTLNFENSSTQNFEFSFNEKPNTEIAKISPAEGNLLLMPNASIMKSGAFDLVCDKLKLGKVADNSHLFATEDESIVNAFPGRVFRIIKAAGLSKGEIKEIHNDYPAANIICRNFPLSPAELQKKLKIKDGGKNYIIATTDHTNKKVILCCEKLN